MSDSWLHTIPVRIHQKLSIATAEVEWAGEVASMSALRGVVSATREPVVVVAYDLPTLVRGAMSKAEAELLDVSRAFQDLYDDEPIAVSPGPHPNEPPDAIVSIAGTEVCVEATQLLVPAGDGVGRLARWSQFQAVRDRLITDSGRLKSQMRQHRGQLLLLWFGEPGEGLPPPRRHRARDVIENLKRSNPPRESSHTDLPDHIPADQVPMWTADDKSVGCTWAPLPRGYTSNFHSALGFEVGFIYNETITQSDLRRELRRLVDSHDSPRTEILVVTLNAPLRDGWYFPASSAVAVSLFQDSDPLAGWRPEHLKSVILHDQLQHGAQVLFGFNAFPDSAPG